MGFCNKHSVDKKNSYLFDDFVGIFAKNGKIRYKNKSIPTKIKKIINKDIIKIRINK